jgi:hypothetical protein
MLDLRPAQVERLTETLAPRAREGGGTESDVLVLLHRVAHYQQQRPFDFDYVLNSTFNAVDDLTLEGVHGLPLKALVKDARPLVEVCVASCELLWPKQWAAHQQRVERRNLQIDHARLSATVGLSTELEELQQVRERMQELGVEPDADLEAQVRRERDAAGIPAPPWDK